MTKVPEVKKVRIGPIACYREAFAFLEKDYLIFLVMVLAGLFIANAVPVVLQGPMYCGLAMCLIAKRRMEKYDFNLFFRGFDYFGKSIIGILCATGVQLLITLPAGLFYMAFFICFFGWQQSGDTTLIIFGGIFYFLAVSLIIITTNLGFTLTWFTCCLVVDRQMDSFEAFKIAFRSMMKNLFELVLHALVGSIIYFAGLLLCCVGFVFLLPLIVTAEFIAYEKVFGLSGRSPHDPVESENFQPARSTIPPVLDSETKHEQDSNST